VFCSRYLKPDTAKRNRPTTLQMKRMMSDMSRHLREGDIRLAQEKARALYDAMYFMGLLPELKDESQTMAMY
jgi:hypothetical protein